MSGPVNVGTSVFALKYKDGVMVAADTAISYGGMRKHKDTSRMDKLGEEAIFSCSGEMADFQNFQKLLTQKYEEDLIENDGACFFHPKDYFNWIARTQYQRRLKSDPLWVTVVVAGINKLDNEVFLGQSDFHGTKVEGQNYLLTGLAHHYCSVLFANNWRADMTEQEARELIESCMKVMFFRDKKAHDQIQISTVTLQDGVKIGEPYKIEASTNLEFCYN
mmetsp:Transcript_7442/g.12573  ORF Transcript_7442/g.12573 Transcript_7442/m.12573 type:complete len:220 (-) Transcript_7442:115-774(-)|eukprot:CAMPEP_0168612950 /NCGR_PEP_ID=MMETSP0449_2-20121227/3189_1 /TAXON_ID=1082188 /ORGANISM="Strombidium rassoulzadegani, Strain ras09" /LENGTH=219 /DNA_ID=CAMNT_0008653547 /DNA_START=7 /DNA_END=666 /DNA_ORIENTATION=+